MSSRSRLVLGGVAAVIVLSVAACGGSSATKAPGATTPTTAPVAPTAAQGGGGGGGAAAVDAGSILTQEVATSIIGGTVTKISIPGTQGSPMSIASFTNTTGDSIVVMVQSVPTGAGAGMLQAAIKAAGAQGDLQVLNGLGDAAGKVINDHDATIAFAKGDTLVVAYASADASSGSDIEAKLEALAKQIAGKL